MIDNNLNFDTQLNKTLTKMANTIRSIFLVRHLLPLKAGIGLLKSLVFFPSQNQCNFFESLSFMSLQRVNRQIKWGIKGCHLHKEFDSARDLLLKDKILPAELFIKKSCLLKFFDLSQYKESSREAQNSSFGIFGKYELTKNTQLSKLFQRLSDSLNEVTGHWSEIFLGSGKIYKSISEKIF